MKACNDKCIVWALLSALMLICCSNCGSGTLVAGGGIGGTGFISRGVIAAFGSIVVNGTEFDISNAVIIVEGEEIGVGDYIALDNLDVGRVVTVEGTLNENGSGIVANRVTYNDNVEGPVENVRDIYTTTKEMVVLGQTVLVNVLTEFKGTTFDTVEPNDVVEVSGLVDDRGTIRATFLEKTGEFMAGLIVEVQGSVVNLDTDLQTFRINDLTVDYSLADISSLPGGMLADGLWVEVEGVLDDAGGEMLAMEIELEDEVGATDADQIEVMGFVTDFVSAFEFTVGNQAVQADEETLFVDGMPDNVAPGVKLEAEGGLVDGILFAEEIEFWDPDQIELEGFVTDFVSVFEFTVGNQVVHTDSETEFVDGTPDHIALGVKLEIKGSMVDSILVADKVSFEDE